MGVEVVGQLHSELFVSFLFDLSTFLSLPTVTISFFSIMSLDTSDPSSSSLYVPPELLSHIFSFCPPSSLATITRTNLTSLELASPFLYKSIRLEGAGQLERLFNTPEDGSEGSGECLEAEDLAAVSRREPEGERGKEERPSGLTFLFSFSLGFLLLGSTLQPSRPHLPIPISRPNQTLHLPRLPPRRRARSSFSTSSPPLLRPSPPPLDSHPFPPSQSRLRDHSITSEHPPLPRISSNLQPVRSPAFRKFVGGGSFVQPLP